MATGRQVQRILQAQRQREGAGFVVRRPFPAPGVEQLDPFLLLDEMGPTEYAPGEAVGAPDHPHRGFETVTYFLEGESEHEDSAGHKGVLRAGDVQWMTAGRGVVHSEMPSRHIQRVGGRMHGFQLWVNLPRRDKMMAPRYQEVPRERIPTARSEDGRARVVVIAGEALGARAIIDTRTPILFHHWTIDPGGRVSVPVPAEFNVYAYAFAGRAHISDPPREVRDGQLAILGPGDAVTLGAPADAGEPAQLLLLGGEPLREPLARYGPFVMNTPEEIRQAILDYQSGRMGEIDRRS